MITDSVFLDGSMIKVCSLRTVIVGAGPAGLAAALYLYDHGQKDICIVSDSDNGSTSRFARSDAQSYYRLADYANEADSPYRMAKALNSAGGMDGDVALVEAAYSSRAFYNLTSLPVAFPHDDYGEYKPLKGRSDDDKRQISLGSHTSETILEALEKRVNERNIPTYKNYQLIRIFTDKKKTRAVGILTFNKKSIDEAHQRFLLFNVENVILATGGPGGLFRSEGYPSTHAGCLGIALEAGCRGANLTEFQYGLLAQGRSLTMNGAFQEALPRYVSVDQNGKDAKEFLLEYFETPEDLYRLQTLKGRQWGFEARRCRRDGSSIIDLLIYNEIHERGRHVFMDYRANPTGFEADEAPYERLLTLSPDAYRTLIELGIDPKKQAVEVVPGVADHLGGLWCDHHFESNIRHLFPIGEAAGTHSITVPAGSSLNLTQVSAYRAAGYIASQEGADVVVTNQNATTIPGLLPISDFAAVIKEDYHERAVMTRMFLSLIENDKAREAGLNVKTIRKAVGRRMDRSFGIYRIEDQITQELEGARSLLKHLSDISVADTKIDLAYLYRNYDLLITEVCVLSAMLNYLKVGGKSRGAYLVYSPEGTLPHPALPEKYRFSLADAAVAGKVQELTFDPETLTAACTWRAAKPIPRTR